MFSVSTVRIPPLPFTSFNFYADRCAHCLFGAFIHRCLTFSAASFRPNHNDVAAHKNHYKTLGIPRNATAKEIKTAFFELTKKHHPDMNPEDKSKAAEAFQSIIEAYEVLGSEEKKQLYDALTAPKPYVPFGTQNTRRASSRHSDLRNAERPKDWTDLDMDFRDFEHFQRENRRRQMFHDWTRANTTSEHFWSSYAASKSYKNPLAIEREQLEKRLHAELMERRKREKVPLPTFDALHRQELNAKQMRAKERLRSYMILLPVAFLIITLLCRTSL